MSTLSFSAVITSYNYRSFVEHAIDSALSQTLPARELVIVDDGSTDGSAQWLQARHGADPRVKLILKQNGGQLSAFVAGVRACNADVICFLDSDDWWEPGYLELLASIYAAPMRPDFVYTNVRLEGLSEGLWTDRPRDHDHGLSALAALFLNEYLGTPTVGLSMKRPLAVRILDLPDELIGDWAVRADDCLILGASALGGHKYYSATSLAYHRIHECNASLNLSAGRAAHLAYIYRRQKLLAHYARVGGFNRGSLRWANLEFKTKPSPSFRDLRNYLWLNAGSSLRFFKRLERSLSMLRWYLMCRFIQRPPP